MIGTPPFFLAVSLLDYDKWFPVYWVCARTFEKRRGFIWPYDLTCVHDVYDPADDQRNPFGSRCQTVSVDKVQILKFYSQIGSTCQLPWNPILKQQTTVWLILSSRANSRDGLMKLTSNHHSKHIKWCQNRFDGRAPPYASRDIQSPAGLPALKW